MRIPKPRTLGGWLIALMLFALVTSQAITFFALTAERRFLASSIHRNETFRQIDSAVQALASSGASDPGNATPVVGSRTMRLFVTTEPVVARDQIDPADTARLRQVLARRAVLEVRVGRRGLSPGAGGPIIIQTNLGAGGATPGDARIVPRGLGSVTPSGDRIWASVRLEGDRWLNVGSSPSPAPEFTPTLALAALLSALSLTIAAVWAARRLTRPLQSLSAAAEQLGRNSELEVVPEEGPEDLRRVTREFNAMANRVRLLIEEQQFLLRAVGHDLRTPLSSLKIRAEFIDDDELKQKMIETIGEMEQLTTAALEAARGGAVNEPVRRIDIAALAEAMCEDAAEVGQPVVFEGDGNAEVLGRSSELKRAIQNMIDNGVRYGGNVRVSVDRKAGHVVVRVEDDGPGVPDADLARVAEPFVRLDLARNSKSGGFGLGLTITKAIAERHSGTLCLHNREAGGLTASIKLPA